MQCCLHVLQGKTLMLTTQYSYVDTCMLSYFTLTSVLPH